MNNYRDFHHMADTVDVEEAKAIARQANERERASGPKDRVQVYVPKTQYVDFRDGVATRRATTVEFAQPKSKDLGPGMVRLRDGNLTPYRAAEAAGLLGEVVEYSDDLRNLSNVTQPRSPSDAQRTAPQRDERRDDRDHNVNTDDSDFAPTAEEAAVIEEGILTLRTAEKVLGKGKVDEMTSAAVMRGELPKDVPAAMQGEVQSVIAGYVAEANAVLRKTGANVALLDEMLDDNELRLARQATFTGDDKALREIGAQAIRKLQHLPYDDPKAFKEYAATLPAGVKIIDRNGRPYVVTPNWQMPWAQAVAEGRIGF